MDLAFYMRLLSDRLAFLVFVLHQAIRVVTPKHDAPTQDEETEETEEYPSRITSILYPMLLGLRTLAIEAQNTLAYMGSEMDRQADALSRAQADLEAKSALIRKLMALRSLCNLRKQPSVELNAKGHFHQVGVTMAISGFRYDRWWREGTEAALQWALRNGGLPPKQIYR